MIYNIIDRPDGPDDKEEEEVEEAMTKEALIPTTVTDEDLEEAWFDQLRTTQGRIESILKGYISDDGLDYLHAALDLSQRLTDDYIVTYNPQNFFPFLRDLAKPLEDQQYAEEGEVLREIDNYATDGVAPKLHQLVNRIAEEMK